MKSICFTGHRKVFDNLQWVRDTLSEIVFDFMTYDYGWFISGGALGADMWFLESAISAKKTITSNDALLVAAIPFPTFWNYYSKHSKENRIYLENIKSKLDIIINVSQGDYTRQKMFLRNRWLVDNHDIVMAIYDGRQIGGTFSTLKYARKKEKEIHWIDPKTKRVRIIGQ